MYIFFLYYATIGSLSRMTLLTRCIHDYNNQFNTKWEGKINL